MAQEIPNDTISSLYLDNVKYNIKDNVSPASKITDDDITNWNNKGTYSKPSSGIPKQDLTSAVQTSLNKADSALQSYTETDPVFSASAASGITSTNITNWNNKQNAIDDLASIRSGAALGATALQSYTETDPIYSASVAAGITQDDVNSWDAKQNAISDLATIRANASAVTSKADDSAVVHLDGVETVIGEKQFNNKVKYTHQQNYYAHNQGPTSAYAYGVYQWGDQMQYTLRNASTDAWMKTVFGLDPNKMDVDGALNVTGAITGASIVKSGGTSSQFLKADGSVDSNTYIVRNDLIDKMYSTAYEAPAYQVGMWFSDLTPAVSSENPPKVGEYFRTPRGNVYQIINVDNTGDASKGGGTFDCGPLISQFTNRTSQLTNDSNFMSSPSGGTEGQVLTKTATGTEWSDAKGGGNDTVYVTQEEYDALTPEENVDYVIYGDGTEDDEYATKKYVDENALPKGGNDGQVLTRVGTTGATWKDSTGGIQQEIVGTTMKVDYLWLGTEDELSSLEEYKEGVVYLTIE